MGRLISVGGNRRGVRRCAVTSAAWLTAMLTCVAMPSPAGASTGFPGLLANDATPTIAGTADVGARLTAVNGTWSGLGTITYAYQWQRCAPACSAVPGATSVTYPVTTADQGARLEVVVTATNPAAVVSVASVPTPAVTVSEAVLRTALTGSLAPHGATRDVALALQTSGYHDPLVTPAAGRLTVAWYRGAHTAATSGAGLTRIASGVATARSPGAVTVPLTITTAGRRLVRRSRSLTITALATLTPPQSATVAVAQVFTLR